MNNHKPIKNRSKHIDTTESRGVSKAINNRILSIGILDVVNLHCNVTSTGVI